MKACVLKSPGVTEVLDVPVPQYNDDEVLVRITVCGVCTSEMRSWLDGRGGVNGVLGHEPVGIIEAMGKNVSGFKVGDRVTGLMWGAFAEYTTANFRNILKVPEALSDKEALGEPLACLVSAAERTTIHMGDTVAVIGLGYMGLAFLQLMRIKGAGKLIAVDIRRENLETALRFGADEVYLSEEVPERYKVTEWAHVGKERGVEAVAEVSGSPQGLELAGQMTGIHGVMSIIGWHQNGPRTVNMELWNLKGFTIINAHERRSRVSMESMKSGLTIVETRRLNMQDLVTHEYPMDQLDAANHALQNKPEGFIKAILRI